MMNRVNEYLKFFFNRTPYLKEFSSFTFGYFFAAFFSFLIISTVNKLLEPSEIGRLSYFKSIFELLYAVLSISIYSSYLRFNIDGENKKLTFIVLSVVLSATIILAVIIGISMKCIACSLFALVIIFNERIYYFRSLLDIKKLNWIRITPSIITFSIILIVAYLHKSHLNANSVLIAYGIGYTFVLFFLRGSNSRIDKSCISNKKIVAYCLPVAGLVIVDWVLNLSSQILIKEYFSFAELSKYAIAQRLLFVVKLFSGLFLMFYPTLYFKEIKKRNINFILKSRKIIIITMFLIVIIFYIFSKYIYLLMGAESYISHQNIFKILLFSEFFKVTSSIIGLFISYKIQTYKNLIILSIGSIINVVLMLLFLKKYGLTVAAYANLASNLIICILYYNYSYKLENKFFKCNS